MSSLQDELASAVGKSMQADKEFHGIVTQNEPQPINEIDRLRLSLETEYKRLDKLLINLHTKNSQTNTAIYEAQTAVDAVTQALKRLSADQTQTASAPVGRNY